MRVDQIMSTAVITVAPEATLKEVASVLATNRISGVPVCAPDGALLGVVSEADVLWKELGVGPGRSLLERILESADGDDVRLAARTAGEAMTSPPVTIAVGATVAQAARLMLDRRVNRLPVLADGKLVGIVARSDLVCAFRRSDEELAREITDDVLLRTLWVDPAALTLAVTAGEVEIGGEVESRTTASLIETYIRRVPGVVDVVSKLTWSGPEPSRRYRATAGRLG